MEMEEFEKHKAFLLKYAMDNNVLFRMTKKTISVSEWRHEK
jgi:hypothetical protein